MAKPHISNAYTRMLHHVHRLEKLLERQDLDTFDWNLFEEDVAKVNRSSNFLYNAILEENQQEGKVGLDNQDTADHIAYDICYELEKIAPEVFERDQEHQDSLAVEITSIQDKKEKGERLGTTFVDMGGVTLKIIYGELHGHDGILVSSVGGLPVYLRYYI